MHNRMGTPATPTSGLQLPALSYATHARVPYWSSSCAIGTHSQCTQSIPVKPPAGIPVRYEACACSCHTPNDATEPQQVDQ